MNNEKKFFAVNFDKSFLNYYFFLDSLNFDHGLKYAKNFFNGSFDNLIFNIKNEHDLIEKYYEVIESSVMDCVNNKKEVSLAYSGGLDSNFILSILRKNNIACKTFTLEFETNSKSKAKDYELAEKKSKKLGSFHTNIKINCDDFIRDIKSDFSIFEKLFNFNNINIYYIGKKISSYSDFYLSGDGTEEQLSFYSYHNFSLASQVLLENITLKNKKEILPLLINIFKDLIIARSWEWSDSINIKDYIKELYNNSYEFDDFLPEKIIKECFSNIKSITNFNIEDNFFNFSLYFDFFYNFCHKYFMIQDIIKEKLKIETKSPFMNNNFISFNSSLPIDYKIKYKNSSHIVYKYLFRKAACKIMEEKEAFTSFKSGSDIPLCEWMVKPTFESFIKETLDRDRIKKNNIINYKYTDKIIKEHYENKNLLKIKRSNGAEFFVKKGRDHTNKILRLLSFQLWWENNYKK